MRRIFACVLCVVAAAVLMIAGHSFITQAAFTATPVCGTLSSDTAWIVANSPYEVCSGGVTVSQGVSLTIEPGVTVQFQSNGQLTVGGEMSAAGTPTQPITFTGVVTAPTAWRGILGYSPVVTPAQVTLDYVTLEYGESSGYYGAQVYVDHAHRAGQNAGELARSGGLRRFNSSERPDGLRHDRVWRQQP